MMRASPVIQTLMLGNLPAEVFPITRSRICYRRQIRFCQAESAESGVDGSLNFTTAPQSLFIAEKQEAKAAVSSPNSMRFRAMARVSEMGSDGQPHPLVLYLLDIGMDIDQIQSIARRHPRFAFYSVEGKIKPLVELLLGLGVNQSDIPTILSRRPQLCGISVTQNLIPTMTYLENLGVDKEKWAKVIYRGPSLLTCSRHKLNSTVDYLHELGLTAERVGKVLTRFPGIMIYSVEGNLRPTAEYFSSLGVDVAAVVFRAPQVLGLSIEGNLKPITEFFLKVGFSKEEVGTMVTRFGVLYTCSLVENIIPKWEFFQTMDYPMSDLVKFPRYFSYSLEDRIKPRYAQVSECGLKLSLNGVLTVGEPEFEKLLKKKMLKKKLDELGSNIEELTLTMAS